MRGGRWECATMVDAVSSIGERCEEREEEGGKQSGL
jgi:hypothetical protein